MRIIQISPMTNLDNYGAQRTHTLGIAENLVKLGNEVHLIVGKGRKSNDKKFRISTPEFNNPIGVGIFSIPFNILKNNLSQWFFLKNLEKQDLIYERFLQFSFASILFSKVKKIPLIYEINGIPDEELFGVFNVENNFIKKMVHLMIKFQLRRANCVVVQTKELKKIIQKKFKPKNIEIVPNGTDLYKLPSKKKNSTPKICYIGELDDLHNLDQVFECTSSLKNKFLFYIVGGGTLFEKYKLNYREDKRFIFKGQLPHNEAIKIINKSDLCIASNSKKYFLFKKYGFYLCPLKLLEYSMAGKVTILFNSSNSFTKIFEKNKSCFITNSKEDFKEKLILLLNNPQLTKKMGMNARRLVENNFTWTKSAKKTEKILRKIISEHNGKTKVKH